MVAMSEEARVASAPPGYPQENLIDLKRFFGGAKQISPSRVP